MADHNIIPTALAIKAMRDNGYKNAAYALAELVDNSVEAGASEVQVIAVENEEHVGVRRRARIQKVIIADNGCGMSAEVLRKALQFGNGTRLQSRKGIGRFGMGLPNASFSQAKEVDVYSWESGDKVHHTRVNVDEVVSGAISDVPQPTLSIVPPQVAVLLGDLAKSASGTVVVWSNLDRLNWRQGKTLLNNTDPIVGRVYRKQLAAGSLRLIMRCWRQEANDFSLTKQTLPNDPLALMQNSQAPSPYDVAAAFVPWGEAVEWPVLSNGKKHTVRLATSIVTPDVRNEGGSKAIGKHMARLVGLSVLRADRELELQSVWVNSYDPRERWWGMELEFPPALDEVFGVDNSKQHAHALNDFGKTDLSVICVREGVESVEELKTLWESEEDPRRVLLEVTIYIKKMLSNLRAHIKTMATSKRTRVLGDPTSPEAIGTTKTDDRKGEGHTGKSDADESRPEKERTEALIEDMGNQEGLSVEEAGPIAMTIVQAKQKYHFYKDELGSNAFFTCRSKAGVIRIGINTEHPAYDKLIGVLDEEAGDLAKEALASRLRLSNSGLKLLLEAWARLEDEAAAHEGRDQVKRIRTIREDWGSMAMQFLED